MAWLNNIKIIKSIFNRTESVELDVGLDDEWSANYVSKELIDAKFLMPLASDREQYSFVNKESNIEFGGEQTFAQAGVKDNGIIYVILPQTLNMPVSQKIRDVRIENDYREMCNLCCEKLSRIEIENPPCACEAISWIPIEGEPPFVEKYKIIFNMRTIIGINDVSEPIYSNQSEVLITIPADYPLNNAPTAKILSNPIFHPNWWTNGMWSHGAWTPSETLGMFIIRMAMSIQFEPHFMDFASSSNHKASQWVQENLHSSWFPCDNINVVVKKPIKIILKK